MSWLDFIEYRACCVIGNETQYKNHIEKSATDGDERAGVLSKAVKRIENTRKQILRRIDTMKLHGLDSAVTLCQLVAAAEQVLVVEHRQWGLCAVTGAVCDIRYAFQESPLLVRKSVKQFLLALWVLFHTEAIEAARVYDSLPTSGKRQSMRDLVTNFLREHSDTAHKMAAQYEAAEALVTSVLETTLDATPQQAPQQ